MKRIVMWVMSTLTALVLLFGYHTSTSSKAAGGTSAAIAPIQAGSASTSTAGTATAALQSSSTAAGQGSAGSGTSSAAATATSTAAPATTTTTVTGSVAQTRWGPVQVQLTVTGRKITNVAVIQYPNGNGRDAEINSQALPILVQETLDKQSAQIDMVSGATVTSDGYLTSLQSALDQAGI